jgi:cation-transporting ATPase E
VTTQSAVAPLTGLTEAEAQERRARGLGNTIPPATNRTYRQILKDNVFTFVNNVIFLLALALVVVGRPIDALVSVAVIATNIVVSVVQEVRAKRVLDRIALLTCPTATVLREGKLKEVAPDEVVVGDTLKVAPGDQVLVDGRVVGEGRMQVDESALTGESNLIAKEPGDEVYSGSFCVSGSAFYEAERVGEECQANRMTASARAFRRVLTPLQQQVNLTIRLILAMVVFMQVVLIAGNLIKRMPLPESIAQSTVVVGLVPNGLFVAIAVAYAMGAVRIVRFGALVQQSNAIESLSNVDVLCLDKTGTLTTNRLVLHKLYPIGTSEARLAMALSAMARSTSAPNKTSQAIAEGLPGDPVPVVAEVPFASDRKWSAIAFDQAGLCGVYAMGAPEMLRSALADTGLGSSGAWEEVARQVEQWASLGLRVLLVAHHPEPGGLVDDREDGRLPDGMVPVGLVSLGDEMRPEARETLERFMASGVSPKVISGDHPETVAALAMQAGLGPGARPLSGLELAEMSVEEFQRAANDSTIFGRITPQQKEALVDALRTRGHYVAMIGDGVNDVLSLKKANLGVAMQSGSQATRSVADIVLMNDSFAALAPAVAEGQRIVNGMQDVLKLFLTRIAAMALVIVTALMVGLFPIDIRHGTVLTLWTVGIPSVLLAYWARPGRKYPESLVRSLAHFVVPAAILSSLLGLAVFYGPALARLAGMGGAWTGNSQALRDSVQVGQTSLASFLVLTGLLLVVFVEPPTPWWVGGDVLSGDWRPAALAGGLALGYVGIMVVPFVRDFFNLQALSVANVLLVVACTVLWMFLVRAAWRGRWLERFFGVE